MEAMNLSADVKKQMQARLQAQEDEFLKARRKKMSVNDFEVRQRAHMQAQDRQKRAGVWQVASRSEVAQGHWAPQRACVRLTLRLCVCAFSCSIQTLTIIGRGAFGEVRVCRKKDDKKIYAMKIMKKSEMLKKNQVRAEAHALNEPESVNSCRQGAAGLRGAMHSAWRSVGEPRAQHVTQFSSRFSLTCAPFSFPGDVYVLGAAHPRRARRVGLVRQPVGGEAPLLLPGRQEPVPRHGVSAGRRSHDHPHEVRHPHGGADEILHRGDRARHLVCAPAQLRAQRPRQHTHTHTHSWPPCTRSSCDVEAGGTM